MLLTSPTLIVSANYSQHQPWLGPLQSQGSHYITMNPTWSSQNSRILNSHKGFPHIKSLTLSLDIFCAIEYMVNQVHNH